MKVRLFRGLFRRLECKDLEVLLQEQWSLFAWQTPECLMGISAFNEQIKVTELLRTKDLILRLFVCQPDLKLPQHAKTAREVIHILNQGQCKAKIGPIEEWVKEVNKTFYEFLPTAPQVIHVRFYFILTSEVIEVIEAVDFSRLKELKC